MKLFYLDTSIWLDFYEKRGKHGEFALKLVSKIINEDLIIVFSDLNIGELKHLGYSKDEISKIFTIARLNNLRRVHIYKKQIEEAKKIARQRNLPKKDALHAIICRDNTLQLIARDTHFEKLKDIALYKKPEEIS